MQRCDWAKTEIYEHYHDEEWGVPVHDDRLLFEFLVLEGAQAGLSWITILKKRAAYRKAFAGFDPVVVGRYGAKDVGAPVGRCRDRAEPFEDRFRHRQRSGVFARPGGVWVVR